MLDPVIMDREYEAQTAGSMTRSEQNTNPVVAERDHITIIDIVVDVEILPCIRPVREKWIFRPKIVVDFTEIGFAAKAVHQPLAATAVVKVSPSEVFSINEAVLLFATQRRSSNIWAWVNQEASGISASSFCMSILYIGRFICVTPFSLKLS